MKNRFPEQWKIYTKNEKYFDKNFIKASTEDPYAYLFEVEIFTILSSCLGEPDDSNKVGRDFSFQGADFECSTPYVDDGAYEIESNEIPKKWPKIDDNKKKMRYSQIVKSKAKQSKKRNNQEKPYIVCISGSKLELGLKKSGESINVSQYDVWPQDLLTDNDPMLQLLYGTEFFIQPTDTGYKTSQRQNFDLYKNGMIMDNIHGMFINPKIKDSIAVVSGVIFMPYIKQRMDDCCFKPVLYLNPNAAHPLNANIKNKIGQEFKIYIHHH